MRVLGVSEFSFYFDFFNVEVEHRMAEFVQVNKDRQRLIFGGGHDLVPLPDMVEVQRESYRSFFQEDAAPEARQEVGLQALLREISPISNFDNSFRLEFLDYTIGEPAISQHEAEHRSCTWHRPVNVRVRLHNDKLQEVREEEVYLGDFPVMTPRGTFIINGSERVVVNQLARSAGVYFKSETGTSGVQNYSAKIIPERGAWVEFIMAGDSLSVNIDSRRKLPATVLLKAFGLGTNEELLRTFGGEVIDLDIVSEEAEGRLLAEDVTDSRGQVLLRSGTRLAKEGLELLWEQGRTTLKVWNVAPIFVSALEKDPTSSVDEALLEILRRMRPNEPVRIEGAREYFDQLFLDVHRYTLGRVGRYKMNRRLGLSLDPNEFLLTLDDLVRIVKGLVALRDTEEQRDDVTYPEIGEEHEAVFAVTIPEETGSFRKYCRLVGNRAVTEFNYRISDRKAAHVLVGIQTKSPRDAEDLERIFRKAGLPCVNLTHDDLTQLHVRHMVGGKNPLAVNERLFRFTFPEYPGALLQFLTALSPDWNISLFHYRNNGGDHASVLCGLQVPGKEKKRFQEFLDSCGYPYEEETDSPAYRTFLYTESPESGEAGK